MKRIFVTSIVSTVAVGAPGDATLSRGVRDSAYIYIYICMYLHLLRGYILAEFSINQTDVSSTYRVVERERENNASLRLKIYITKNAI